MSMPRVGDVASATKTITDGDVRLFAELSGDRNPVHLSDAYASRTRFGQRIAHGVLVTGLISNVIGMQLPGEGAIYLSQNVRFTAPAFIGDTVTATATVKSVREDKPIITLETRCVNQRGETLITGESTILYEPVSEPQSGH
jgi:3-hydroxybutyryl-CoA dehydratase